MKVSYNRLWKLLIDRMMSAPELREKAKIAPNTMTKMRKNQAVSLDVLYRICEVMGVEIGDIMCFEPENTQDRVR